MSRQAPNGFSLVELVVAISLMGLVITYVMQSVDTQHQTYVVVDQVTEAQQNARTVAELVERDLRMAGFKVPDAAAVCGLDSTTAPDRLYVSDAGAIATVDALPMNLRGIELGAQVLNVPLAGYAAGTVALTLDSVAVDGVGVDFVQNAGLILVDANDPDGNVACGVITGAVSAGNPVSVLLDGPFGAPGGFADVRAVPAHVYQVVNGQLLRDGVLLADDVEDFQVAFFVDGNENNLVDAEEYLADGQGVLDTYSAATVNHNRMREVRINVVMTTRDEDPREEYLEGRGQVLENRAPASVASADGRRRRVHTATVQLRNVGG